MKTICPFCVESMGLAERAKACNKHRDMFQDKGSARAGLEVEIRRKTIKRRLIESITDGK